ncbi:MAG: hypothetical protein AAGJ81_06865 [Verrucomicrobiota bacterium]
MNSISWGGSTLLGGFDDSSGVVRQDAAVAGLVDLQLSGNRLRNFTGSTDGLWGSQGFGINSALSGEPINQNYGNFTLVVTVENHSGDPIEMSQLHFQSFRDHWKSSTDVDISLDGSTKTFSLGGTGSWNAFDIDISEIDPDTILEPGVSRTFTLEFNGAQGNRTLMVDNLGISGVTDSFYVVRWGLPGGKRDIVSQSISNSNKLDATFDPDQAASPVQGSNYFPDPSGFSPRFFGASSVENEEALIANDNSGDRIQMEREIEPNQTYAAMIVWKDFLNPANNIDTFSIKKDDSHWTAEIYFRWVIQVNSGEWYASFPIAETGSLVTDKVTVLNWYPFEPFADGEVTFGTMPVEVDLSEAVVFGFYFEAENGDDFSRDTGLAVSYFAVSATEEPTTVDSGVKSVDTGYTVLIVRNAVLDGESIIVGSSYEGTVVAYDYAGNFLWENPLVGLMARDIWCDDLNSDGNDEILVALADGSIRCLDGVTGNENWSFFSPDEANPGQPNGVPMKAVCTIRGSTGLYIACGGFDKNLYWLDAEGNLLSTVPSSRYSDLEPWGVASEYLGREIGEAHTPNFLRPVPQSDGTDKLLMLGYIQQQFRGRYYLFDPLGSSGTRPSPGLDSKINDSIGALEISDPDGDGAYSLYAGGNAFSIRVESIDLSTGVSTFHEEDFNRPFKTYRFSTLTDVPNGSGYKMFILCGNKVVLRSADLSDDLGSVLMPHAPHSMWHDRDKNRILFASAQSGGSSIHIVDLSMPYWKQALRDLDPPGKLRSMKANYTDIREKVRGFVRPAWERLPDQMIEVSGGATHETAVALREKYGTVNPLFMTFAHTTNVEQQGWKNSVETTTVEPVVTPANEPYLQRFDNGITYGRTRQQLLDQHWQPKIDESLFGLSFRAGHGNDPYYYNPDTLKAAIDASYAKGPNQKTVLSWAEVQATGSEMKYPIDRLFREIANHLSTRNGMMAFNNKHLFWGSTVHREVWSDFISGEFKEVFSTCMEESTSKTGELSLSHRLGLWASGCFDIWGMRTTRDNTSFDRTREIAAQIVPNHFLRHMVYRLAYGARYSHSSYSDMDYQSLVWELVASGALYLPRREEIVSFSPVHFGVKSEPDERYVKGNVISKWSTYYDAAEQSANPMVIGRLEGCWVGARNTEWDFSTFAAGVLDRRQNFIPPYPHGMVLTTPVENGLYASRADSRERLRYNLHPLYRNRMTEIITDGRNYIEADGSATYAANSAYFYSTVRPAVENAKSLLPIYLSGDEVGWVCAQSAPNRLRLTLVDSGYLNPGDRLVTIHFNTVKPVAVTDLLSNESIAINGDSSAVLVPLGMFTFLDIELSEPFFPDNEWGRYASDYGLSGLSTADADKDGVVDLAEFAFQGHPWNARDRGHSPNFSYNSLQKRFALDFVRLDSERLGINYIAEWTDDLRNEIWSTDWSDFSAESMGSGSRTEIYGLDVTDMDQAFFRIRIEILND